MRRSSNLLTYYPKIKWSFLPKFIKWTLFLYLSEEILFSTVFPGRSGSEEGIEVYPPDIEINENETSLMLTNLTPLHDYDTNTPALLYKCYICVNHYCSIVLSDYAGRWLLDIDVILICIPDQHHRVCQAVRYEEGVEWKVQWKIPSCPDYTE